MVKNKHGGNRHKKMASKNAKPQTFNRKVRFAANNDQELYAKVEKVYGGNKALVSCNDGRERMMEWRRKFAGRNKRDNFIAEGCIVLVGKREWQVMHDKKKEKVDLLEVYQVSEIDVLKKKKVCPVLFGTEDEKQEVEVVEFTHEGAKEEYSWSKSEPKKENKKIAKKETVNVNLGEDINWDDI
jgi:initiation factor 1A